MTSTTIIANDLSLSPDLESTDWVDKHFLHRGYGVEFEMEAQWIRQQLPTDATRIADIGCGIGALFDVIGQSRAMGVDYSGDGLTHTRRQYPTVPLYCAHAESLPFADGSLDAITLQHVVEHLDPYDKSIKEWYRAIKPGGLLIVLTPNAEFCDPSVYEDSSHVHIFDRKDLRRAVQQNGFEVVEIRTLGLPWFRQYRTLPMGWRLRRFVTTNARFLSNLPWCRWKGQTLCCVARKPESS